MLLSKDAAIDNFFDKKAEVLCKYIEDTAETGRRFPYQLMELLIYFGWPLSVSWTLSFLGFSASISVSVGAMVFLWPLLKGLFGKVLSKQRQDPRHSIRSSSFWFDGFLFVGSPILREIRKYSALTRSLDAIYNYFGRFGLRPRNFPSNWWKVTSVKVLNMAIKLWSDFWIAMPIAQDVRTRLEIVADEYRKELVRLAGKKPGRRIRLLEIAGGQLQAAIMGIRRAMDEGADFIYEVVSIEPDADFSTKRALELIDWFGLDPDQFVFIDSTISTKRPDKFITKLLMDKGYNLSDFQMVVCIGLGDYYHTHSRIAAFLGHLRSNGKVITANICGNFVERFFLHHLIQWPKMTYRSLRMWGEIVSRAFPGREVKILQTPHRIFNIAVISAG